MPRVVEETWVGVAFEVVQEQLPRGDGNGGVQLDEQLQPVMQDMTTLVFSNVTPDGRHTIKVPFDPNSKTELIRKLTGGIVVPTNGNHPV